VTPALVDQLSAALDDTGTVIAGIAADQWSNPTPCAEWDVHALVNHLVTGNGIVVAALTGEPPSSPGATGAAGTEAGGNLLEAYRRSREALVEAFGRPEALDRMVEVPIGSVPAVVALHLRLVEALVHGWDLVQATGQPSPLRDDLAEQELRFTLGALGSVPPGRTPFAPPQPVPDDAPTIDRLAALLGRSVPQR
jgi:uncharacterized protein (TIGR03086 family)